MKKILRTEICKERPNAAAFGAFNRAIKSARRVMADGSNDGQTFKQVLNYFRIPAAERARRSREAFDKIIYIRR